MSASSPSASGGACAPAHDRDTVEPRARPLRDRVGRFAARHARSLRAEHHSTRKRLVFITVAWLFGAGWMAIATSAVLFQYARSLGVPDYAFGLLTAAPFMGALAQLGSAYAMERLGRRRELFLTLELLGRGMWVAMALLPWVLPGLDRYWGSLLLFCCLVSWAFMQAGGPAWMNWMSDVIPERIRGRYMALRGNLGAVVVIAVTAGSGWALDQSGWLSDRFGMPEGTALMMLASILLGLAGVAGCVDILWFLPIRDDDPLEPKPHARLFSTLAGPLRDRRLWPYLGFNFLFNLGIGFVPAYVALFLIEECGFRNASVNLMMFSIPPVLAILSAPFWGRFIDRHGNKPTLMIAGWIVVFGGFGWVLMTPDRWLLPYALVLLVVLGWPGVSLANQNLMMQMSRSPRLGAGKRSQRDTSAPSGAAYVAVCSIAVAAGGLLSGVVGGSIAWAFADMRWETGWWDVTLTYHGLLILVSMSLRALAMLMVAGLHEPEAADTTVALRYMTGTVYTNLRDASLVPARYAQRSLRWARRGVMRVRAAAVRTDRAQDKRRAA